MALSDYYPWACAYCRTANPATNESCKYCGFTTKVRLYPVAEPNTNQGTPSYDELCAVIEREEKERYTDAS